jgi:hypothetical protein
MSPERFEEEEALLASLQRLRDALRPHNSHWADVLARLRDEAAGEFSRSAPVSRRYQLARKIEGLFGGMSSLNDIERPGECERLHTELFAAVQNLLRVYWRALGRPSHSASVTPLPVGAVVRLIPGTTRYFERDESPVVVADTATVRNQEWRVVRYEGPDITNMPSYLVQQGSTFLTARHESLEVVGDPHDG